MNIYFYLKNFPPLGDKVMLPQGTIKAVHGLASGLVNCGARVKVLCETHSSKQGLYETQSGYEIIAFGSSNMNPRKFNIAFDLQNYIRDYLDDKSLVILNGIFHAGVYSMSRILKKYGVPYIVAPHDPYSPAIFSKNAHLKLPYWYLFERKMLKQAKAIQVLDSRHAKFLHQRQVNTPVLTVYNGFSAKDVYPESSLQWQKNDNAKLFFLGRIDSYNKGLDILIDAFSQIAEKENIHLTIQGPDWGDKQTLQAQVAKLNLDKKVSFLNPDFDKSPSFLIQSHDVFCIPSRFEGFSLAAVEAMLAGRVLLVSEIAGIAPHVEASGCGVVVASNISDVKSGIGKLLQRRSEWKEMGLAGRHYVLDNLQWEKIASFTLEEYKKLLF
ncbi:MAG: glycosyltransferase [Trichormus sp. ATA11-4-KO1]|jgi:glycosyltransferase involved in cell wall biosynthesis|nr:glycosyltransferase [Trichormus sp. ATA11-4-KO1]